MKLKINLIRGWTDSKNNWVLKRFIDSPIYKVINNDLQIELIWLNQLRIYKR